jgi:histidine triad (HIT) family protein
VFQPPGLNLWQSNGAAGGQEVPHFHLHVQPRRVADGLLRVYPDGLPAPASREELNRMAEHIRLSLPLDGVSPAPRSTP